MTKPKTFAFHVGFRFFRTAAMCVAGLIGASNYAVARSVEIKDLIEVRKVGQMAISPNGQEIAYLVVHAITADDSYSISLIVTSVRDTRKHREIVQIHVPAVRTQSSDYWEDIGSNLTGGIAFAWIHDGKDLVYGTRHGEFTTLYRYSPATESKTYLWKIRGELNRLVESNNHRLRYCVNGSSLQDESNKTLSDPAYRYDQTTFHFWDKHPWQDGRIYKSGQRPPLDIEPEVNCFERNETTQRSVSVPSSAVFVFNPFAPTTINGPGGLATFGGKAFEGNRVGAAWKAPDGKKTLYAAELSVPETASEERKSVFFVEWVDGSHAQRRLFEIGSQHEGTIRNLFWAPNSEAIICVRQSLDRTTLTEFEIETGKEKILLDTEWGISNLHMSSNGRYLYASREKPDVPKQLCRVDLLTGDMLLVDELNQQFIGIQIPPHIPIRQFNHYGDELTGYLFFPPGFHGERRLPFVAIRGQQWNAFCDGGTGVEFPGMTLAMQGYVVLFFEPSAKHFPPSQNGNAEFSNLRFLSPIESLRLVISELTEKGWIDSTKTGIAGLSAGADIVDYASGFSDVFSVGAATTGEVYAPANYFLFSTFQIEGFFSKRYVLPYPDLAGLPAWQKVSSSLNASRSRMPLLLQPGDGEAWMTIGQHLAWQHAQLPIDTYVYPDEGHIKIHPLNRYYTMTRNLQWFNFWLTDAQMGSAEFVDQFRRWDAMKTLWIARRSTYNTDITLEQSHSK